MANAGLNFYLAICCVMLKLSFYRIEARLAFMVVGQLGVARLIEQRTDSD